MKIETEPREDHQLKIIAELESSVLEKYKLQAARKISHDTKIPGFRPGKAPYNVIRRMFGDEAIQEQAVELMVDAIYPEMLKEAEVKPSYPGSLEEVISLDPPKLAFLVPLASEVTLGDYRSVRKEYSPQPVTEDEVNAFVKRLQSNYATAEPVDHPAQDGDLVAAKVTGTLTHPEEGEEAEFIKETPVQLILGDSTVQQDTWPYPGFSKELIGLSENEEKDILYVYPEDSDVEKMRGKEINFHVVVQSIKAMHLPEINDEFAQSLGEYETVEVLRKSVREQLESTKQQEYDRDYFNGLVDEIIDQATIKFPPQMLAEEEEQVLRNIEQNLSQQRMDLDTYLKLMQMDKAAFVEKEVRPTAKHRLEHSLVLDQIARDENIRLAEDELQSAFSEAFQELQATTDLQKMQRKISSEKLSEFLTYEAASRALNRRVMQQLKLIATGQGDVPQEEETPAAEETEAASIPEAAGEETAPSAENTAVSDSSTTTPENNEENDPAAPEA